MIEVDEVLEHTRSQVLRDFASPQLFSDPSLIRYLNEGYAIFARTTHAFTREFELDTIAGQKRYDMPSDVIHVRDVVGSYGISLGHYSRKTRRASCTGRPTQYTTDTKHRSIKFWPVPDNVYTFEIEAAVLPERVEDGDELDLDYDHGLLLPHFIAFRTLMNNDPDGSQTVAASDFQALWLAGLRDAKMEFARMKLGDQPRAVPQKWT